MTSLAAGLATNNPLDHAPMQTRQILVLVTAVLLAALDGYDALSMAFVAPVLSHDWHIGKDVVGVLLSSSLAGMAIGAIVLSGLGGGVPYARLARAPAHPADQCFARSSH